MHAQVFFADALSSISNPANALLEMEKIALLMTWVGIGLHFR